MSSMTTSLTQRSDAVNTREWTAPGHSLAVPYLVKQKRVPPANVTSRATDVLTLIKGGVDGNGEATLVPITVRVDVTRQANMADASTDAVVDLLRDIVNSDNFVALVRGQGYLQ